MSWLLRIAGLLVVVWLARNAFYTVDASEYAYVTVLGRHVATFDGGGEGAGLHVGWPWPIQAVQRLDRRLQQFDLAPTEHLTPDALGKTVDKTFLVEAFVVWKIADVDAVDRFVRHIGTIDRARPILSAQIISELGASLGKVKLDDLINVEPGRAEKTMDNWQKGLLESLQGSVREKYGIDLVDIRLRRFYYQGKGRDAIFERIRSERNKKVTEYLAEGDLKANNIKSAAEEKYRTILAEARYEEERLKGLADTEAMQIRNQAHSQDPEFYAFLKQMEKLQSILGDNKTVLLLSTQRPFFDLLFQPPQPKK